MNAQELIDTCISGQDPQKREDMQALHRLILRICPDCKLWFLDGRDAKNQIVSNPNIGYGSQLIKYANGKSREFYKIGVSPNTTGISIYVMGLNDKRYLFDTYWERLGKAKITGYCIKFRCLSDINLEVLGEIITTHMAGRSQ